MASTNKTTNLKLPQWVGTDHPSFSDDFNPAFLAIDDYASQMKTKLSSIDTEISDVSSTANRADTNAANAESTANTAKTTADTAASTVSTVSAQIGTPTRMTCDDFDNLMLIVANKPTA